jgi:ATP-dependent RNA helicase DeaD
MTKADPRVVLGPALTAALDKRGFTDLTPVQLAVLDPKLGGRDLRISSQTGSGKTVAIGFTLRDLFDEPVTIAGAGVARPRAIVIAPTRELARQVEQELGWLYAERGVRATAVTGGTSYRDERRALGAGPGIVVGTPGRLVDHLDRGGIDPSAVGALVLDEADRMLDMGFREELLAIFSRLPETRRTHLVSATFPKEVRALADRAQRDPVHLEGTRLGEANADIEHVVCLVEPSERVDAVVNLLAAAPDARTLVFARTRADVSQLAAELVEAGFPVGALSGEMDQRDRNRALAAFKRGQLRALVATDVAARGIDVHEVSEVIHVEAPGDADAYTHRSGRTGRAGRKGRSVLLATIGELGHVRRILDRARVRHRIEPLPTADEITARMDDRLFEALTAPAAEGESEALDARVIELAARLGASADPAQVIARLLVKSGAGQRVEPRALTVVAAPVESPRNERARSPRGRDRRPSTLFPPPTEGDRRPTRPRAREGATQDEAPRGWALFDVTWGDVHGADARRLLALVCRRGNIQGSDVGAIRVGRTSSQVEVALDVAEAFARAASAPDPRDPRVRIRDARDAGRSQMPPPMHAERDAPANDRPRGARDPRQAEGRRPPPSAPPPARPERDAAPSPRPKARPSRPGAPARDEASSARRRAPEAHDGARPARRPPHPGRSKAPKRGR